MSYTIFEFIQEILVSISYRSNRTNLSVFLYDVNDKNCSLSIVLTAMDQELQKS